MTSPARFTQADLTRAFKAAEAAGVSVRIEIEPDGRIVITRLHGVGASEPPGRRNSYEGLLPR